MMFAMEILGTVLVIMNIAVILPLLFIVAVLAFTFVLMIATAVWDRAPSRTLEPVNQGHMTAS